MKTINLLIGFHDRLKKDLLFFTPLHFPKMLIIQFMQNKLPWQGHFSNLFAISTASWE
ncbi:hypothetical protein [Cytobacillus firmus]|uniref:hypothetical protein n=1 Tax=Cytobacillus firmus TaxID=1399 RepID=UPI001C8E5E80|nr:hypothetical protein [Cytobacillus firmus]MBX9974046.1 hypothetical protein [Cytobacillus firmus]